MRGNEGEEEGERKGGRRKKGVGGRRKWAGGGEKGSPAPPPPPCISTLMQWKIDKSFTLSYKIKNVIVYASYMVLTESNIHIDDRYLIEISTTRQ